MVRMNSVALRAGGRWCTEELGWWSR